MTESEEGSLKVLLEEMNDKFSLVLEGHDAIRQEFKDSHRELEEKITLNSSLIKFGFETLDTKIDGVRTELKEDIQGVRTELKEDIQGVRTELKEDIQGVRTELKEDIQGVRTDLKEDIQGVRTELKEDIQGVRTELKEIKGELSAKIEAVCTELKDEMAAGFNALGSKVEGHEDRIRFLERKAA